MKNDKRTDALENREALLISAKKAFAAYGPEASLNKVAQNAGVSRSTLYRNFSDRDALILAVLDRNIDTLERQAEELVGTEGAFADLVKLVLNQQIEFEPLISFLDDSVSNHLKKRMIEVFEQPIRNAKSTGRLKSNFYTNDILLLINMLGGALTANKPVKRRRQAQKALSFLFEGILHTQE